MKGYELQDQIQDLNEQLEILKEEIVECGITISQLKKDVNPEELRQKFRISKALNSRTEDIIEQFKNEILWRKQVAKWIRRERAIYLWERRLRKTASIKLPFMHHQLKSLNKQAYELLCQMKNLSDQLIQTCQVYQKTCSKHHNLLMELERLSFQRFEEEFKGSTWMNMPVPTEIKELKFLDNLERRDEGRVRLVGC